MQEQQRLMNLLIVEDSPEDRTAIRRYLLKEQSRRFILHEAKSGQEGLACCQHLQLDCVLLDYNLPDMFGIDFLERLRTQLKQPFVPVIILTGSGSELIAVQAMKGGAQDYLLKDQCTPELLYHTITYAIEKMALQRQLAAQRLELEQQRHASSLAARETTQRMDEFVGIVSHELKTPLTSLRGNLQLAKRYLKRSLPPEDGLENQSTETIKLVLSLLDRAEQQLMAQNRLVNDLVDVTRIQIDKLELQVARCDLKHLVQEIIDDQRSLIATRTILFEPPLEEITVLADAQRIGQVVNNYLSNALKYSDKEKPVLVQIELFESVVQVSVHDEGPGISLEAQQRIWERFYRVPGIEARSGAGVGLGLGLHICRTIIEQQGGAVGVESVQGQGSTFWFTLPYAQSLKTPEEYSSGVNN